MRIFPRNGVSVLYNTQMPSVKLSGGRGWCRAGRDVLDPSLTLAALPTASSSALGDGDVEFFCFPTVKGPRGQSWHDTS